MAATLTEAERGYGKTEGESLAILSGIMANKEYLYGTKFEVVTDHKPLVSLYNAPNRPAPVRVDRHKGKLRHQTMPGSTQRLRGRSMGRRI